MANPQVPGRFIILFDMLLNNKPRTKKRARNELGFDPLNLDPNGWYDTHKTVLPYVRSVQKQWFGSKDTLSMLTREIYPTIKRTTDQLNVFKDPVQIFQAFDTLYKSNNRGDGIGSYECTEVTDTSVTIKANDLYPTDFNVGLFEGVVNIFEPDYRLDKVEVLQRREEGNSHSVYKVHFRRN